MSNFSCLYFFGYNFFSPDITHQEVSYTILLPNRTSGLMFIVGLLVSDALSYMILLASDVFSWIRFTCCLRFHLRRNILEQYLHWIFFSTPHSWFMWRNMIFFVEYHLPHLAHWKFCPFLRLSLRVLDSSAIEPKPKLMKSVQRSEGDEARFCVCVRVCEMIVFVKVEEIKYMKGWEKKEKILN